MGNVQYLFKELTTPAHKPSATFKRHAERLKGKAPLAENEIKALCWAMNGVKAVNLSADERQALLNLLHAKQTRPITKEQTAKGIEWLKRLAFKSDGSTRNTKDFPFGSFEIKVIREFHRFEWVGIYNVQEDRGYFDTQYKAYVPVWRVVSKDGAHFDYYVSGQWGRVVVV